MILLFDFGSQYTYLIVEKLKKRLICFEIIVNNFDQTIINNKFVDGIILSGGPETATNIKEFFAHLVKSKVPILGICYGMQLIGQIYKGDLINNDIGNFGNKDLYLMNKSRILAGLPKKFRGLLSHNDVLKKIPPLFIPICGDNENILGFESAKKNIYCLQFHPEASDEKYGDIIFDNFLVSICHIKISTPKSPYKTIVNNIIKNIKNTVKNEKVILGLSGGLDSAVTAILFEKAIGSNLTVVYVNNGLMRIEDEENIHNFVKQYNLTFRYVDATKIFLDKLKDVDDPQQKRKIIGETFIRVFENCVKNQKFKFLGQGTILSDVIESAQKSINSKNIKHHHNVSGLPKKMKLKVIEPIDNYFKNEVKEIGRHLGINEQILNRHPFPGPGFGIRIIGKITREMVLILRGVDNVFTTYLKENNLYQNSKQAFAILLPIKSVGVQGDNRTYKYVCVIRSIVSSNYMTAEIDDISHYHLEKIAKVIVRNCNKINRVCYDITSKPPGTIEWE